MKFMKFLIRIFLNYFGYDIIRYKNKFRLGQLNSNQIINDLIWLKEENFKTIIDIGANEGQFSEKIRLLFPESKIFAFEPLPDTYQKLKLNFKNDKIFKAINYAVGDTKSNLMIEKNEYSPSSSLLEMNDTHKANFNFAIKTEKIEIETDTLDNLLVDEIIAKPILIKIDVQGFEDKVIKGGKKMIENAEMIICETSFYELYNNQTLFGEIYSYLTSIGFEYKGNIEQLKSPINNKILQADAIFKKMNKQQ